MAFVVPTIYEAIDKITGPLRKMANANANFASSVESVHAKSERLFRKFVNFANVAVLSVGLFASIQALNDYEDAVASFRTIVGGKDTTFQKYQDKINEVAKATKKSSIEVAQSFENIAGLNAKFAETADSIGLVSKAAITLSKASGDDLTVSAQNLVGIMNQFSLAATEADRTINVLAAGQAVGAANITKTSEAFVNFGSVASGANISLEKSVALVQVLGKFSIFGAEAGTKLRGSILKLQQAGLGYASGQFDINDALAEATKRLSKLTTAKQKDAVILKLFGAENIATGKILLNNIALFDEYSQGVTGKVSAAQDQANIKTATLTNKLKELQAGWINIITGSSEAGSAMHTATQIVSYLTDNLEKIVSIGIKVIMFFAAWKAILIVTRVALIAYNVVLGISGALSGRAAIAVGANTIALGAYRATLAVVTAAQWLWNAAMLANPIGLIIVGIAAMIGLIVTVVKKYEEWGAALSLVLGPLGFIINTIMAFRRNWDMIMESFKNGGILSGLKAIGATILDSVLMPLQQVLKIIANLTGFEWAKDAMAGIEAFRSNLGIDVQPPVNSQANQQAAFSESLRTERQNVAIDINDKTGRAEMSKNDNPLIPIRLSSTMGM